MSTTYSFYFKGNDGKFYPLDSFGGGSKVAEGMSAQFGRNCAYETRKPLTKSDLKEIISFENDRAQSSENRIEEYRQRQKDIGSWNNSIEDKMRMISDLDETIDEEKCDLSYYKHSVHFFEFLSDILDEAEYSYSDDSNAKVDVNNYIYWEVS